MKKPLIGITASMTWEMSMNEWAGYKRNYLSFDYVNAVEKAGGVPIIIPVLKELNNADEIILNLDGIIFSGGSDVSPISFGNEPERGLQTTNYWRDLSEIKLIEEALKKNLPILCICRGFQLINLFFKGTVHQDLNDKNSKIKHAYSEVPGLPAHSIDIEKDSLLFDLLKKETILVNSHHHQGLDKVANEFKVIARAKDDVVEAIEYNSKDKDILGVQFHPEILLTYSDDMLPIFKWLIDKSLKNTNM